MFVRRRVVPALYQATTRLDDIRRFAELGLGRSDRVADSPLSEAVTTSWPPIGPVFGLFVVLNIGYYVVFTFLPTYFIKTTLRVMGGREAS